MIAIIDYGVGNLRSVEKAFGFIGAEAVVSSDSELILGADAVVLPGVGAFADAMDSLERFDMINTVKTAIDRGKPFLGICLGMQLLFEYSQEGGERVRGLGVFKGSIRQLPLDMGLKVPHMGWNSIKTAEDCAVFGNLSPKPYVYFVHSYYLTAEDRSIVAATARYGIEFDVAVCKDKVCATQFHPEKSGETGLQILKNWVASI
ncbi:imidazole glycerol phosphate synthase subunit HisH [Anaerobacterium chartisolvens]|uniref:Imidazole glycerol phosphate synthase subunit HisH n=1 Tax=Anaerobacterium chartisolvens TaxID=1297424 RepID=A0A369AN90_9FIRM|nr:imidazole glycerol phosphate synthase subunit HisH [Anaerobacterium chartisolvens]RCX08914.1 imidazole glycerol phosphate synthase subunit HisH [Anaerobacterium chartisolvens]